MPELAAVLGEYDRHRLRLAGCTMGDGPSSLHTSRYLLESDSQSLEDHACETVVAIMVKSVDCLSRELGEERKWLCIGESRLD